MADEFRTRGNLRNRTPRNSVIKTFSSTSEVKDYLQKITNTVTKNSGLNHIDINVITTKCGRKFLPFVVSIDPDQLISKDTEVTSGPVIFNPVEDVGAVQLPKPLRTAFSAFAYNKDDKKQFFSDSWRKEHGVDRTTAATLKDLIEPKKIRYNNGNDTTIVFLIDPIRVFYDMAKPVDRSDNRRFEIDIVGWKEKSRGEYEYSIDIVRKKNKNRKYNDQFIRDIDHMMHHGRRFDD